MLESDHWLAEPFGAADARGGVVLCAVLA